MNSKITVILLALSVILSAVPCYSGDDPIYGKCKKADIKKMCRRDVCK